jgi:hypothetical protein
MIFGLPFFYAYQLAWVPLSAIFLGIAYALYLPLTQGE